MRVKVFSDLHGRSIPENKVKDADLIILAGDITNFGGKEQAKDIIEPLLEKDIKILAVPGNCDRWDVNSYLEERNISIFKKTIIIREVMIGGIGGGNISPFSTPQEYSEEEIEGFLQCIEEDFKRKNFLRILVTHVPPHNTKTDRLFLGRHVGSKAVRKFIEKYQPEIVVTGHIHESRGEDKIKNSRIFNPGPGPLNHLEIKIENKEFECRMF